MAERPIANPPEKPPASLWSPRRIIAQLIGFTIGIALLVWCINNAIRGGDWSRIAEADPLLVAALLSCSIISLLANGTIFFVTIRPVQPLRWSDLQLVNLTTSILNYAPIRLGLIARIAYHIRVDRVPVLRLGGWFAAVLTTMALCMSAAVVATALRPQFDLIWLALLAGQIILGGLLLQAMMSQSIIVRYGRGMHHMLSHPTALWGAIALRLIDIAAFVCRMACAVAIMKLELSAADIVLLALATLALTMNPLGRFGFREAGVAIVAQRLASDVSIEQLEGQMAQLALVESAGEALVFIPLGALALLWYRHRWKHARRDAPTE